MKLDSRQSRLCAFALAIAMMAGAPAWATITYSCDPSITTSLGLSCATLNATLDPIYSAAFADANANIYIAVNTNAAVSLGESVHIINGIAYSAYLAGLKADDPSAPGLASLPSTNPYGTGLIDVTNSLLYALPATGVTVADGVTGTNLGGSTAPGFSACSGINPTGASSGCYDGIVLVNGTSSSLWLRTGGAQGASQYDFYSVVEHETDEVLGTSSCLGNGTGLDACQGNSTPGPNSNVSAADLFRYVCGSSARSFSDSGNACFSVNGGTTDLKQYNNLANGDDFGDWATNCANVQDATGCLGPQAGFDHDISPTAEIALLNAAGFSLNSQGTPEPGTFVLVGTALLGAGLLRHRIARARKP
jgi:hypothetical protein